MPTTTYTYKAPSTTTYKAPTPPPTTTFKAPTSFSTYTPPATYTSYTATPKTYTQTITTNTQHPIRHHLLIVTNISSLQPHIVTIAVHLIRAIQQVRPRVKGDQ